MKKLRNFLVILACLLALCLAFTACSNGTSGDPGGSNPPGGDNPPSGGTHTHSWGEWTGTAYPGTEMRTCITNASHTETRLTGTDRFTFEAADMTAYRVRKGTVTTGAVIIPAYYRPDGISTFLPVTEIGSASDTGSSSGAFSSTNITNVIIPETVTAIRINAFVNCTNLASTIIPANVTSIGSFAFSGCSKLTNIAVNNSNPNYASEGGILYNKAKTMLIAYPSAKGSITIPDSVTSIGSFAFTPTSSSSLTSVTFAIGSAISSDDFGSFAFPPDYYGSDNLRTAYLAGGAGTYTRTSSGGSTWTKQQ